MRITLLFATLFILVGHQAVLFGIFARTFAVGEGLLPASAGLDRFYRAFNLERGIALGSFLLLTGGFLLVGAINQWRVVHFGDLDYRHTMRWVIPGMMLAVLGLNTILGSFLTSVLAMRRK